MIFSLAQVRQIGVGTLRLTYTTPPVADDSSDLNDALNPNNYDLSGPDYNYVSSTAVVEDDPLSIDLYLAAALHRGTWTVAVSNVQESGTGNPLSAPTSIGILISHTYSSDALGHGASNDETKNVVRKFLNPALKGIGWDSMIEAVAAGDQVNWDNARLAFDQLFLSSASEAFLRRRASDEGIEYPRGTNMDDDLFRQLAIVQKTKKLTQEAILEVLEVFYGRDATRAFSESAGDTFALTDRDDLVVLLDERQTITVTFMRSNFTTIAEATALEVSSTITRQLREAGSQAFAAVVDDPTTGESRVRIYSGSLGLTSSVRIVGGKANTVLLFATSLFEQVGVSPFAGWTVTQSPDTQGNLRFTMSSGTEYDLFLVQDGDLAYIYGDEFAAVGCDGTYEIEAVSVTYSGMTKIQWFEISNPAGSAGGPISQTGFEDLMFFRPKRRTIYDSHRHVIVCENDDHLDVVIPATTDVVDRGPGLAAYLNENPEIDVLSLIRTPDGVVTVETDGAHGLDVGSQVIIDGAFPDGSAPALSAGTPSGNYSSDEAAGTTDSSPRTTLSLAHTYEGVYSRTVRLEGGELMIVGGQTQAAGPVITAETYLNVFSKTSEAVVGGGVQQDYLWQRVAGNYHIGRQLFAVSVLADGRVLASGGAVGDDISGTPDNGWDLWTWLGPTALQDNGTLPAARASHSQASLAADSAAEPGGALVTGGWTVAGTPLATALLFDVGTKTWSSTTSMGRARMKHESVALAGDRVIVVGGSTGSSIINHCEIFDCATATWAPTGKMSYARFAHALLTLPDGRLLVVGGVGYNPSKSSIPAHLTSCEVYDPNTGLWASIPPMRTARAFPVAAYQASTNTVIVAGGTIPSDTVEVLDVGTMKWRTVPYTLASALTFPTGGLASDNTFLVAGGTTVTEETEKTNYIGVMGADQRWVGAGLNSHRAVATVPDGTHFTYETTEYADYERGYTVSADGATITTVAAQPANANVPGPFIYDVKTGLAITATNAVSDQAFNRGEHYASLHLVGVDPALDFPDEEGFIVFNFGFSNQVGPVRYLGRLSNEDLLLDTSVPFPVTLPVGATVRLLSGRVPFEPERDELVGNFYATGTAAGRVAAQKTIDDIVAAGKQILVSVLYPGDIGLGGAGFPQKDFYKLSDKVSVWGGDDLDQEIPAARAGN